MADFTVSVQVSTHLFPLFYGFKNWGPAGLSHFPKVTQLLSNGVGIQTKVVWLQSCPLNSYNEHNKKKKKKPRRNKPCNNQMMPASYSVAISSIADFHGFGIFSLILYFSLFCCPAAPVPKGSRGRQTKGLHVYHLQWSSAILVNIKWGKRLVIGDILSSITSNSLN